MDVPQPTAAFDLVPDPVICEEFSISAMTLWRWDHDEELNFPPPVIIRKRKYRVRPQIEAFKRRMLDKALGTAGQNSAEEKTSTAVTNPLAEASAERQTKS